ncbi:hypothetical protein ACLKA6_019231 [Drosophila palustris]
MYTVIKANVVVVGEEITMNLAVYVLLGLCSVTSAIVSVISLSNAELPIRDHLPDSETQAESVEGMETQMFDRPRVLSLAHEGHPGESAMKRRLRSKVWWPGIDRDVEKKVKACRDCLLVSLPDNPVPMKRHQYPTAPWKFVATDLLGPLPNNEYILVLIDYFSRYMDLTFLKSISSVSIIESMKEIFCRLGIPEYLRTDNGRQYVSKEFKDFCQNNNITQITTPPYWPQANGEVENMNRSLGKRLKIAYANKTDYKKEIREYVLMYNVTPHGTTGCPPTDLIFGRVIRDKIPWIGDLTGEFIDSSEKDLDCINKNKGKIAADKRRGAKETTIDVGDTVLLRNVIFPSKLTTNFDTTEYKVLRKNGRGWEAIFKECLSS